MGTLRIGSNDTSQKIAPANDEPIIKEIYIEKIVERIVEVIKEVPVEVIRIEKEYIEKPVDRIIEIIKEVPVEIIKEIEVIKEVPIEVEKFIEKEIKLVPKWTWVLIGLETLVILGLLILK